MYMYNMPGVSDYVMAANTFLSERFLFGTAYPFIGFREGVEQFRLCPSSLKSCPTCCTATRSRRSARYPMRGIIPRRDAFSPC